MTKILSWAWARFAEPSTWAGLGALSIGIKAAVNATTTGDYTAAITAIIGGVVACAKAEGLSV